MMEKKEIQILKGNEKKPKEKNCSERKKITLVFFSFNLSPHYNENCATERNLKKA